MQQIHSVNEKVLWKSDMQGCKSIAMKSNKSLMPLDEVWLHGSYNNYWSNLKTKSLEIFIIRSLLRTSCRVIFGLPLPFSYDWKPQSLNRNWHIKLILCLFLTMQTFRSISPLYSSLCDQVILELDPFHPCPALLISILAQNRVLMCVLFTP